MLSELRHAGLRLRAAPVSTLIAVGCLAFGLAAAMIVYSVMQQLILRPTSIAQGANVRVLELDLTAGGRQQQLARWSYPAFEALRDALAPEFDAIAVTADPLSLTLATAAGTRQVRTEVISPGYFQALGVAPMLGSDFPAQVQTQPDARIWLSQSLWRDGFGADVDVVGRQVLLQGVPFAVAGVLPPGFQGISEQSAGFIPMSAAPAVTFARRLVGATSFWHAVLVVPTPAQAHGLDARLVAASARVRDAIDMRIGGDLAEVSVRSTLWTTTRVDPVVRQTATAVGWGAALLLAIVAVNLILLALARQDHRRREMGVRISLGAGRLALLRVIAAEMILVCTLGLIGAWLVAAAGLALLAQFGDLVQVGSIGLGDVRLGGAALAFGVAIAVLILLAVLVGPARAAIDLTATSALRAGATARNAGGRRWLAGTQFALATALTIGAGFAAMAAWRALQVPLGFDPGQLLSSQVSIPTTLRPADGVGGFLTRLTSELSVLPGVERAATAACLPIRGGCDSVILESVPRVDPADWPVGLNMVAGDYFGALGVPLVEGRHFDAGDISTAPAVAVISASAARRYFPGGSAIGRRIKVSIGFPEDPAGATVVGVVGDVFGTDLDTEIAPMVYLSSLQTAYDDNMVIIQTRDGVDATSLAPALEAGLRRVQPELALWDTATMEQRFDGLTARRRLVASLIAALAGLSVLLAGTGVFAVFDLLVRRRQREFGVRLALGASHADLRRSVFADALGTAGVATIVGLGLGVAGAMVLVRRLPGIEATPGPIVILVALLMAATAVMASWWPARRAARSDPMTALRQDG